MIHLNSLFYICHVDNLSSILEKGILARNQAQQYEHIDIQDDEVLSLRNDKKLPSGKKLPDHVNLYFQPRNAMLYRLTRNVNIKKLVVLEINHSVMETAGSYFSDRNAATSSARFFKIDELSNEIVDKKIMNNKYWTDSDDTKQKMMAEVLIPDIVPADAVTTVYICAKSNKIESLVGKLPISIEPNMFFLPTWRSKITNNLFLSRGDMFFSGMQTFTISVNLKGVMGKGLASRTKYQFPDAYVRYQDDCKSKKLKIGKPTLFKRGIRIEDDLADDKAHLDSSKINGARWFLFLATKRHWRENSRFEDIEESMQWLVKNYKKQEIESIALPALGCGLGNLQWRDVGPMMCYYLNQMNIKSCIYLPMDNSKTDQQFLTQEHLLNNYQPK